MTTRCIGVLFVLALLAPGCGGGEKAGEPLPSAPAAMTLRSSAFSPGATIPERYTCDGDGTSPPLQWTGAFPGNARELTLIVEDPDAGRFVHWTVLRIPPHTTRIAEGQPPAGAVETDNSFGKHGWGAPCPPKGKKAHRYVFAIYATDARLGLGEDASPDDVRDALADHALARGELIGMYGR
jgi:hypothetical protein